jgi:hypothetical protein
MADMFDAIASWDNLLLAAHDAALGKRRRPAAASFERDFADNLLRLQEQLRTKAYRPGAYTSFIIHEPKRRKTCPEPAEGSAPRRFATAWCIMPCAT